MPATRPVPARLLPARHQPSRRRSAPSRRWGKALGVALLSGAVAAPGVGASPTSGRVPVVQPTGVVPSSAVSARISATKAPTAKAPASDVRTPSVTSVALGGVSRKVLAAAPEPDAHADEQVGALAVKVPVKPAAAASVRMKKSALVAVTADAAFAAGTAVQVRVKEKSGWSRWSTLEVDPEHGPDPGSEEAEGARPGSDPLLTVAATQAQVRIDTPSGKLPKGTELTLVHAPSAKSDKRGALSQLGTRVRPGHGRPAAHRDPRPVGRQRGDAQPGTDLHLDRPRRVHPPHRLVVELHAGAGGRPGARDLRLPHEVPQALGHRLQLPRRPVRPALRGPRRRDGPARPRRSHGRVQREHVRRRARWATSTRSPRRKPTWRR